MKNLLNLILSIAFCAAFSIAPHAQINTVNPEPELTRIYALQDRAIRERDAKTIIAFYAQTYIAKIQQDTIGRTKAEQNLRDFFSTTSEITVSQTFLEKIERTKDSYIAFITRQIAGTMIFAGGKTRQFELNLKAEEYWSQTSKGEWVTQVGIERSRALKIDGLNEFADVLESSRTELEAVYKQIDVALKTQNLRAMFVYWAPNFIEINNGKTSKSEEIETAFNALFEQITEISDVAHKIGQIKTDDGNYVLQMERTMRGEMNFKGKTVSFEYNYQAEEVWAKDEQAAWKLKVSAIANDKFLINGKLVK